MTISSEHIWRLLQSSRQFETTADYQLGSNSDTLSGQLTVELLDTNQLLITEQGVWHDQQIKTFNQFLWQKNHDSIELSHMRQQQPVSLCIFNKENQWQDAHYCGDDKYVGRLSLMQKQLILEWRITGKNKRGKLTTVMAHKQC